MKLEDNKQNQVLLFDHKIQKFLSKHNKIIGILNKENNELTQVYSLYDELLKITETFIKTIKGKTEVIFPKENQIKDDYFYSTIKIINDTLEKSMNEDKNLLKDLLSNLNLLMDKSKIDNKNLHVELESSIKQIEENKEKLEIKKKLFQESSEKVESNVLNKLIEAFNKKEQFNEALESNDLFKELKINYINYNSSLEKVNKLIEDCNNKQKSILDIYSDFDSKYFDFINNVLNIVYAEQSTKNGLFSIIIRKIKEMTILYNKDYLNNKKIKKIRSKYQKYFFDLLKFENFKSKINFLNVQTNDEFNRLIFTIELFRKNIGDIYPDISIEKEKERNKVREKFFNLIKKTNDNISEEDKNGLYKLLKEDDYYQKLFLSILNRVRNKCKHMKDKKLITMLGNAFNIIIDTSETKKDYDTVNLCIILSQTFFYEDDKKNKIYVLDFIRNNNNWLHSAEFWGNYINLQIIKEFFKYQDVNKEKNLNIFMKNNISDNIMNNVAEILFSQLMTNINNMVDLNVDKTIIVRLCEEFINKYNYLDKNNIDTLYNLISQDKEEINSLREKAKREILLNNNNEVARSNNIKVKEDKNKEYKDEIKEIKENKNEIIEEKNEIKENKNEIIEEKSEIKENKNEIIEDKNEIKENKKEIIKEKNEIKENKEKKNEIIEENFEIKDKEGKEDKIDNNH